ncbi:MAG: hypothetical protein HQK53_18980 [Oligoflexia bacterium]|nr:hypothetical protein [Oligoflexia bacterium]
MKFHSFKRSYLLKILYFSLSVFWAVKRYLYFKNFEKKHITFGFVDGKLQITSTSHEDFIMAVQKRINGIKTTDRKDFIKTALTEALEGCNFIIFSPINDENKYVQFWTGDHKLAYNFYANKTNHLRKFYYSITGLLSESGFVNEDIPDYRGFKVYKVEKTKGYTSVDANFKKDIDLAVEFTETIYKQIYKSKSSKLIAKVE